MTQRVIPERDRTLLDYWAIIWRAKLMIVALVLVSTVATGVISKLSIKLYEAKATLLPAREESMGGGISFGGGKEKGGGASMMVDQLGRASGPSIMDTLTILLQSRRMAEAVVEQLNLMEYYGTNSMNAASNALRGETSIKHSAFKSLEVVVLSRNPKVAADIANAYVSNLDRLNMELGMTTTKRHRLFIEARLAEKTKKLEEAENELKAFQTEHHIVSGSEGAGKDGPMEAAVSLHGDIVQLEVELAALKEYALPSHPMVTQIQAKTEELKKQLDKLEQDQASRDITKRRTRPPLSQKVFPLVEEAPALYLDLLRLTRRVKVEESVYGMLVGSLEAARLAEAKNLPTIQPMDAAIPPEFPSRPKSLQNVQVAAGISLLLGIFLAIFFDYLQQLKSQRAVVAPPESIYGELAPRDSNGNGGKVDEYSVLPKEAERIRG